MRKTALALTLLAVTTGSIAAAKPTTETEKLSYSIGSDIGKNFKQQGIKINPTMLEQGLKDVLSGSKGLMTQDEMKQVVQNFQKQLMMKRVEQYKKQAEDNKKAGVAFLKKNKQQPGIKTTASGLQYKIIDEGNGVSPSKDDTVTVEYTGKLLNGKVFDSTDKTGKPVQFNVGGVIKGWTEALQMMKPGAKWEVFIPSDLAYGARNTGGPIGPNQTLIFTIKLISVDDKKAS